MIIELSEHKSMEVNSKSDFINEMKRLVNQSVILTFRKRVLFVDVSIKSCGELVLSDTHNGSEVNLNLISAML